MVEENEALVRGAKGVPKGIRTRVRALALEDDDVALVVADEVVGDRADVGLGRGRERDVLRLVSRDDVGDSLDVRVAVGLVDDGEGDLVDEPPLGDVGVVLGLERGGGGEVVGAEGDRDDGEGVVGLERRDEEPVPMWNPNRFKIPSP